MSCWISLKVLLRLLLPLTKSFERFLYDFAIYERVG